MSKPKWLHHDTCRLWLKVNEIIFQFYLCSSELLDDWLLFLCEIIHGWKRYILAAERRMYINFILFSNWSLMVVYINWSIPVPSLLHTIRDYWFFYLINFKHFKNIFCFILNNSTTLLYIIFYFVLSNYFLLIRLCKI